MKTASKKAFHSVGRLWQLACTNHRLLAFFKYLTLSGRLVKPQARAVKSLVQADKTPLGGPRLKDRSYSRSIQGFGYSHRLQEAATRLQPSFTNKSESFIRRLLLQQFK